MANVKNPVLPGFNPDPSFLCVGNDYYIATSTFEWFPGVCVHHSTDLANWEILSYALTDENAMELSGIDSACGIWAPNLTYCDGTFYLVYTIVYTNRHRFKDTHNFLVTAKSAAGPWSKPIKLNRSGFDPSLFHAPDGKKWLVNMLLDYRLDKERFGGVVVQEFDEKAGALIGKPANIFKGTERGFTEGPNIFYKDGYYYLTVAEGGTEFGHCALVCRASSLMGPYVQSPNTPLLTSVGKDDVLLKRAGHGQIIQGADGSWYVAHLCSRTIDECSIIGRETAIQNIEWTDDGWCRLAAGDAYPQESFAVPEIKIEKEETEFAADFLSGIPKEYMTLRKSAQTNGITTENGALVIRGGNSLQSKFEQGFLARRQQHFFCDFSARLRFEPRSCRHLAGIVCYYNYDNFYFLCVSRSDGGKKHARLIACVNTVMTQSAEQSIPEGDVCLLARVRGASVEFLCSADSKQFFAVGEAQDMRALSDERVDGNGFTGAMIGMACCDLEGDGVKAYFDKAVYKAIQDK